MGESMVKSILSIGLLAFTVFSAATVYAEMTEFSSDVYIASETSTKHTAGFTAITESDVKCAKITVQSTIYFNAKKQGETERATNYNSYKVKQTGERKVVNPTKKGYWEISSFHEEYAKKEDKLTEENHSYDDAIWMP
ncbi:hypothetical protein BPA01_36810 [Brevibacillus parabrevis]|jgi:hypothetical protein|uniref:Uncharacterized protein n=2 Tax=Brevibacillus TaxID=55080 RepID=A0A4Y3PUI3_BREPA|nr:hypothetical protein BPA01_36810 [Brevibacillus parabrevis]